MFRTLAVTALCASSICYAAGKEAPANKPAASATMKDMVKDAAGKDMKDGGALDIAKMPFSQDAIKKIVAHYQPKIQSCYEETMAGTQKVVEGKLMTSFVITPEGMVKEAQIERKDTTLKEPALHECVVTVISAMTFPAPTDGRDHPVRYPFKLTAVK